jgi:DNA-binding NarL/FixJ family response regulator
MLPVSPVDPTAPALIKRSQTLLPGKASAKRLKSDRLPFALPLSEREQQVIDYRSDGVSFQTIAISLGCSLKAAIEYHRRAFSKLERSPEREIPTALSELLEQALAKPKQRQRLRLAVSVCRS